MSRLEKILMEAMSAFILLSVIALVIGWSDIASALFVAAGICLIAGALVR